MGKGKSWKKLPVTWTKRQVANTMKIKSYGNFSFWIRQSNRTGFNLLSETTTKFRQNIWNNGFQTVDIGQLKAVIVDKREINEVSPTIIQTCCLEGLQAIAQEGKLRQSPVVSMSYRYRSLCRPRYTHSREEFTVKNINWILTSTCEWGSYWNLGK